MSTIGYVVYTHLSNWRDRLIHKQFHATFTVDTVSSALHPLVGLWIATISLAAWLVRIWFFRFERIDWDGYFYLIYARNIAAGHFFLPSPAWTLYPPVYPSLIAVLTRLGISFESVAVLISQVAGVALLLVLCLRLGRHSPKGAAVLGLLLCFNNVLVRYSNAVLSESLFILWIYLLLLVWLTPSVTPNTSLLTPTNALWSGVLIALLLGTRSIGLVFLGPYLLVFGLGGTVARRSRTAVIAVVITLLILGGYTLYTRQVAVAIQQTYGVAVPNYARQEMARGLREADYHVAEESAGLARFMWSNRMALGRMWLQKIIAIANAGVFWSEEKSVNPLLPAWSLIFAGLGLHALRHSIRQAPLCWLGAAGLLGAYCAVVPLFTADMRYYVPLLPGALALAAVGLVHTADWVACQLASWPRLAWRLAWPSALLTLVALSTYSYTPHEAANADNPWVEGGAWARGALHPARVLVEHPAPAYFMGAEPVWLESPSAAGARTQALTGDISLAAIQCAKGGIDTKLQQEWLGGGWLLVHRTAGMTYDGCIFQLIGVTS